MSWRHDACFNACFRILESAGRMSVNWWLLLPVLLKMQVSGREEGAMQRMCTLRQVRMETPFINVKLHCINQIRHFMLSVSSQRQGPETEETFLSCPSYSACPVNSSLMLALPMRIDHPAQSRSAIPMLRRSPRHPQDLKNLLLTLALQ